MAKRRYTTEEIVTVLRQVEVAIANGKTTPHGLSGERVAPPKKQDSVAPHRKSDRPARSRRAWRVCAAT